MKNPLFTIVIGTRNRAEHLRPTLQSLAQLQVAADAGAEFILADNGSTDHTATVFQELSPALQAAGIEPRIVTEPRPGACRARNRALQQARGDIVFLTDDDVRVPDDWLQVMSGPLLDGRADAVAGGVRLAEHLQRDWMTPLQRAWLASTEEDRDLRPDAEPGRIISANMAFRRSALDRVPGFDEELGPGALGFCDDILFSLQLKEAGYQLFPMWQVEAEHHFDASRLSRAAMLGRAAAEGRSTAYFWHHWLHLKASLPQMKAWAWNLKLLALRGTSTRSRQAAADSAIEGCSQAEMEMVSKTECYRQYLIERRRRPNYPLRGLRKIGPGDA